jgi:hypothetical protein
MNAWLDWLESQGVYLLSGVDFLYCPDTTATATSFLSCYGADHFFRDLYLEELVEQAVAFISVLVKASTH